VTVVVPSYAAGTEMPHFADWAAKRLVQYIDRWAGHPLVLEEFQREFFGEALAYTEDGVPVWSQIVLVLPRKNSKTTMLAALAVYRLLTDGGWPEILLAASTEKQAGKLFDTCATLVRKSPWLADRLRVRDHEGEIVRVDGFGKIIRMATNWRAGHGYNPTLVICDELHTWTTPTLRKMWAALKTGDAARSAPQIFTITTAGDARDRDGPILGELLNDVFADAEVEERDGLQIARDFDGRTLVFNYEAPLDEVAKQRIRDRAATDQDIEAVKVANPASWITVDYLRRKAVDKGLPAAEFLQLHGCVWAEGDDDWFPAGLWATLKAKKPGPKAGSAVVFGFDGSSTRDGTFLVGFDLAERHFWVEGGWERPPDAGRDWEIPRGEVRRTVDQARGRFDVVHLLCDPAHWHEQIEQWDKDFGVSSNRDDRNRRLPTVVTFRTNQPSLFAPACDRFETAALAGEFTHNGDARLARHIGNAKAKQTPNGRYIQKEYEDSPRRIDAAVAAVLAYHAASLVKQRAKARVVTSNPW
jgi:phage terminase large subunit-like protein